MDVDSPTSNRSEDEEEEESGYNAELLELEPLREDSEELLDDAPKRDDDDNDEEQDNNSEGDESDDDQKTGSSSSGDNEDEDNDSHVQGLTSNEREILTLLAVDKKLASLLDLAANALSALRPKDEIPQESKSTSIDTPSDKPAAPKSENPLMTFETASAEYYKALDDIQLTLRNSIHLIRKARISPRTLMENPSLGSVLSNATFAESGKDDSNERVNIAPGVVSSSHNATGLSRGAQRMEIETWKQSVLAMKGLLQSLDKPSSVSEQ